MQCKGFTVTPAEVGVDQARQCRASIAKFRASAQVAGGYLLLHNRDHRNERFTFPVVEALAELVRDGVVTWAALWSAADLVQHVEEELVERVLEHALAASSEALSAALVPADGHILTDVPFTQTAYMVKRGTMVPAEPVVHRSGDPVLPLQENEHGITVLTGGFGYGKTTVAARTVSTWGRRTLFLPAARIEEDGVNLATILRGLTETALTTLPEDDQPLLEGLTGSALRRLLRDPRQDLALVVDALDESPAIGKQNGLSIVLHAIKDASVPVIVTMRSELWSTRVVELSQALTAEERASSGRRMRVVELVTWTPAHILAFVDSASLYLNLDAEARERLTAFRSLVVAGGYEHYYGDIPCRPLFLRMLVDDVVVFGVRRRGRLDLVYGWVTSKLIRDHQAPLKSGGPGRINLHQGPSNLDEQLRLAHSVMSSAAAAMVEPGEEGTIVLSPYIGVDTLRDQVPPRLRGLDTTGLVIRSLLVPAEVPRPGRPLSLRFAHRMFQEFFLAENLYQQPNPNLEDRIPDTVRVWLTEMRESWGGNAS